MHNIIDVYNQSRKLPKSTFNVVATMVFAVIAAAWALFGLASVPNLADAVLRLSELMLNLTVQTLGLLLAGFAIFATLSRKELFFEMAETPYDEKNGISFLDYNFLTFMRIMIWYWFGSMAFFVVRFGFSSNVIIELSEKTTGSGSSLWLLFCILTFTATTALSFFLLLLLGSFIFNIYAIIMTIIEWERIDRG